MLCLRSKAWLAARVPLRLARLPHTTSASSAQRRGAAPVLLAHAEVTKNILFFQWVQNLGTHGIGAITQVTDDAKEAQRVLSQLKLVIRPMYSSPPIQGSRIITEILSDAALSSQW